MVSVCLVFLDSARHSIDWQQSVCIPAELATRLNSPLGADDGLASCLRARGGGTDAPRSAAGGQVRARIIPPAAAVEA